MVTFYMDFAVAYASLFLAVLALALLSGTHIETGLFGLIGFPAIGVVYAFVRRGKTPKRWTRRAFPSSDYAIRR